MVKSMYAAVAGLRSHQSRMDVISNNISNVNTWGFKSQSASFMDSMYQNYKTGAGGEIANGGTGGTNTSQVGFGVNVATISVNFTTGAWSPTGNNLDCMINGPALFVVGPMKMDETATPPVVKGINPDDIGSQGVKLSRVGIFSVDKNGYLVDNNGNYVYGYEAEWKWNVADQPTAGVAADTQIISTIKNGTTDLLKPIRINDIPASGGHADGTDTDFGKVGEQPIIQTYKIGDDGTITGTDKNENVYTIGRIAVASAANVSGLEHIEGYYYNVGPNAGKVVATEPTAGTGKIISGYLEMSNVDLAKEMSDLITTQRGYQANTKIVSVTDEMLSELVNMKR